MSKKRMFSTDILESDAFMSLSDGAKVLYLYLCMESDDDGFCNAPRRIMSMTGAKDDDMKLLISKKFVLWFEGAGVCVIKHWRIHNYISKDRYHETKYCDLMAQIYLDENKAYTLRDKTPSIPPNRENDTSCIQDVHSLYTDCTLRLDKNSIDKSNLEESRDRVGGMGGEKGAGTPRTPPVKSQGTTNTPEYYITRIKARLRDGEYEWAENYANIARTLGVVDVDLDALRKEIALEKKKK